MSMDAPFSDHTEAVRPEWIDYSGHMNIAYYGYVFEEAARAFFRHMDISREYRERTNHAFFALESHVIYQQEVLPQDVLQFTSQIIGLAPKRIHCFHAMFRGRGGPRAAINEVMYLHMDLAQRRSVPMPADAEARVRAVYDAHARLPAPPEAGRGIRLHRAPTG
jgi:acyl-CoA thioester hydrolase